MNAFTVIFGGLLAFFVIAVLLLGAFSKRSVADYLDWKPTRSPEAELTNEVDDVSQMIAAQNEYRRRRGAPPRTQEDVEEEVRRHRAELEGRAWPES